VLTVILILYICRCFLKEIHTDSRLLPFLFPFATAFSFFNDYWCATDFLEILFFSLMLFLVLKGRTLLFGLVFIVSFLNRESALFILPFFLFNYGSRRKIKEIVVCGSLIVLAIVIVRFLILSVGNPVFSPESHTSTFRSNINFLKLVFNNHQENSSYLFWKLLSFSGFLYFFVVLNLQKIPRILRHFLLTVGPVNLLFALLVGNLWETRIFYPLIPCLILSSSIILEKRKGKTVLLSFLVITVISLFFAGNGLHLREDSEFAAKSGAFNIEEFGKMKWDFLVFREKNFRFKDDKVIVNLDRFSKKFLFLDSYIIVTSSTNKPKACIIWLDNRIRFRKKFKKHGKDFYIRMRGIRFEMKNPKVQTAHIIRLIIVYSGKTGKENIGKIEWKGFSAEKD